MISLKLAKRLSQKPLIPTEIDVRRELEGIEDSIVERCSVGSNYCLWHVKSKNVFIPQYQIDEILKVLLFEGFMVEYIDGITIKYYKISW